MINPVTQRSRTEPDDGQRQQRERAQSLVEQKIQFIQSDDFDSPDAESVISVSPTASSPSMRGRKPRPGLPAYLAALYSLPLLNASEESDLFRRMNFLKFRAAKLREQLNTRRPQLSLMDTIEQLLSEATEVRNRLIRHNLRLVVSIARRSSLDTESLWDRVSEGNEALMRAVDLFDYSRGFKLSTYATWAIRTALSGLARREVRDSTHFVSVEHGFFDSQPVDQSPDHSDERRNEEQRRRLRLLMKRLDARDRTILSLRFGLKRKTEPLTLAETGQRIGISKERVRQIEERALVRLRTISDRVQPDLIDALQN